MGCDLKVLFWSGLPTHGSPRLFHSPRGSLGNNKRNRFSGGAIFLWALRTCAEVQSGYSYALQPSPSRLCQVKTLLRHSSSEVVHRLHLAEQAPQDFKQDILLPIPKKGDASLCTNYRTIALQSIAGKAYANVLSARLSQWLADNLLDEQCGFRPSRSIVTVYHHYCLTHTVTQSYK